MCVCVCVFMVMREHVTQFKRVAHRCVFENNGASMEQRNKINMALIQTQYLLLNQFIVVLSFHGICSEQKRSCKFIILTVCVKQLLETTVFKISKKITNCISRLSEP